jgi:hypothetical protein
MFSTILCVFITAVPLIKLCAWGEDILPPRAQFCIGYCSNKQQPLDQNSGMGAARKAGRTLDRGRGVRKGVGGALGSLKGPQ